MLRVMVEKVIGEVTGIEFWSGCEYATIHAKSVMEFSKRVSFGVVLDKIIEYVKYSRTEESKCRVK